ncbi:hypothetical protein EPYR_04014 (plasmid) [Erwinia pyrifoliae DSM 12163]|nr:hypothetical protein EPYR_04014 [Erwinia pyrifoliae DSM 12163]
MVTLPEPGFFQAVEQADQGAFSRTTVANNAVDLPFIYLRGLRANRVKNHVKKIINCLN